MWPFSISHSTFLFQGSYFIGKVSKQGMIQSKVWFVSNYFGPWGCGWSLNSQMMLGPNLCPF